MPFARVMSTVFAFAFAFNLMAGDAAAQENRCGPYATPGVDANGTTTCTLLPTELRQQILRARQRASAQRQRTLQRASQLAADQQQRNAKITILPDARDEATVDRDKAISRNQRQPEEVLKQDINRRYWPRY